MPLNQAFIICEDLLKIVNIGKMADRRDARLPEFGRRCDCN